MRQAVCGFFGTVATTTATAVAVHYTGVAINEAGSTAINAAEKSFSRVFNNHTSKYSNQDNPDFPQSNYKQQY